MDVFDRLRAAATHDWARYVEHEFLRQLQTGQLPESAFRAYLVQVYLFLIQFARAYALAVYKGRNLSDMRAAQAGLAGILDVEMDLHIRLCGRWGLSATDLEAAPEHAATIAYTRFVLDCGASGDLLDLHVALAPCVIGYAEIASRIASQESATLQAHPYREWIMEYSGEPYGVIAASARHHLDDLAARAMTERRFTDLAALFATASRLEADFWQMALNGAA
jgi:thiaminase/transcriptional activator TenA